MDEEIKFVRKELKNWFNDSRIVPEYCPSYSPESNEISERLNRTLLDKARGMINPLGSKYKNCWAEEMAAARYIRNMMFGMGCKMEGVTPIEALTGIKQDVPSLRKFSCTALVNIPGQFT